jgi:hypothetical protein
MDDMKGRMTEMVVGGITHRVKRLKKLIELNAPTVVLYNEIARLYEHAQMLGEGRFYAEELTKKAMAVFNRRKPVYDICAEDGCFEECFEECEAGDGLRRCGACHERFEAESAEMERHLREAEAGREGEGDGDDD